MKKGVFYQHPITILLKTLKAEIIMDYGTFITAYLYNKIKYIDQIITFISTHGITQSNCGNQHEIWFYISYLPTYLFNNIIIISIYILLYMYFTISNNTSNISPYYCEALQNKLSQVYKSSDPHRKNLIGLCYVYLLHVYINLF